jgi:plastocyanin
MMIKKIIVQLLAVACCLSFTHVVSAGELNVIVKDGKGAVLADAIITAMPTDAKNIPKQKKSEPYVDQVGKEFMPHVLPVYVNSLVSFPNNDSIRHHVYSFSPAKKFELPLYSGTSAAPVLFDKPGVIILGCNIHDWMLGYVYVSATPFFTRSDKRGKASISNLPDGEYMVKVWHPLMIATEESTGRRMVVPAKVANEEWQIPLKRAFKLPRNAAVGRGFGY